MADDSEVMEKEITTIPAVIADRLALAADVAKVAQRLREEGIRSLVLVGCGDSLFACETVELAFRRFTDLDVRVQHAMEFSRYSVRYLPAKTAVVVVSFSGKVGRSIESVKQAQAFGHLTIALTGNPSGPLAEAADVMLSSEIPTFGFSPGTSTYTASTVTLLTLAQQLAVVGQSSPDAELQLLGAQLSGLPQAATETLELSRGPAESIAAHLKDAASVTFVGAGPSEASAHFGAAKMFEGPQLLGVSTNLEEWAHEQYFITNAGDPIVVIAPRGASTDRAEEILQEINYVGGVPVYVSDEAPVAAAEHLPIAPGTDEYLSGVLASIPLSWLGVNLMRLRGRRSYNFASEEAKTEHYDTIHRVTIGTPA
jgi:glucosamine 6-phosphate synthetase-like amidotransferase/phosphosugar isomerase protein